MDYNKIFGLEDRISVVTGGAGLIGKEITKGLGDVGSKVIIADIDRAKGKIVERELREMGIDAVFAFLDISKESSVSSLIAHIAKKYGPIDIWVNSAYPKAGGWVAKLNALTISSVKKNLDMHLVGYLLCCRNIAEHMKSNGGGSIINMGSIYGSLAPDFEIYKGTKMTMPAVYSLIKGGIINMTRYLASYYGADHVRVNCVSPGVIKTTRFESVELMAKTNPEAAKMTQELEAAVKLAPIARLGLPQEIANAAVFLASDVSSYITGQTLSVDGGRIMP